MKHTFIHAAEDDYRACKRLALSDIPPHESGRMLKGWTRGDIFDEMLASLENRLIADGRSPSPARSRCG